MSNSFSNLQREIVVYLKLWTKVKKPKVIRYIMKRLGTSNSEAVTIHRFRHNSPDIRQFI